MRLLVKVLQAVLIVLALMMMIFLVLDGFNPTMNFLRNGITKGLLWTFSLLALADEVLVMGYGSFWQKATSSSHFAILIHR